MTSDIDENQLKAMARNGIENAPRILIIVERVAALGVGNGKEHINAALVAAHAALGFDVAVLVTKQSADDVASVVEGLGGKLVPIGLGSRVSEIWRRSPIRLWSAARTLPMAEYREIGQWANACAEDVKRNGQYCRVVVSLLGSDAVAVTALVLRSLRAASSVVLWEHRTHYARPPRNPIRRAVMFWRRRVLYSAADVVSAVSSPLAQIMAERLGFEDERICIIPNVVNEHFFVGSATASELEHCAVTANRASAYVLATQNFTRPQKALGVLLDAAKIINRTRKDIRFLIVGATPNDLPSHITRLGLGEVIRIFGKVRHDEMPGLVQAATVAVVPSLVETFSIPAAEALAGGVPVVATICGGPEDFVVDRDHGRLVPPGDAEALAAAIIEVWDKHGMFNPLLLSSYARGKFSLDAWIDYWRDIHRDVVVPRSND